MPKQAFTQPAFADNSGAAANSVSAEALAAAAFSQNQDDVAPLKHTFTSPPPISPTALMTRDTFAAALTERGFPITSATLATKATRGGGPPFRRFGRRPLYEWGPGLAWAQGRLSPLAATTSEHRVKAA